MGSHVGPKGTNARNAAGIALRSVGPNPSGSPAPPPPFVPTDIAGCTVWLNAGALVLSNNDPVASWTDLSGNGNNAVQATGSLQPLFKTAILNSQPVVRFDGLDDVMQGAISGITSDATIFVVAKFSATGNRALVDLSTDGTSTNTGEQFFLAGAALFARTAGSGAAQYSFSDTTSFFYFSATYSSSLREIFQNGVSQGTDGSSLAPAGSQIAYRVGELFQNIFPFDGDVAEVIIYNSVLSGGDLTTVNTYLATKYGF